VAFLTRSELQSVPVYNTKALRESTYHTKTASVREHIFLSHSHKDADIVNQAVELLGNQGVRVYVDWKDDTMPAVTSPVTATRIKQKISSCSKFVLLATNAAIESRWVPWELGIADEANSIDHVAIMPVRDPPHVWQGNEYIGIYSTLERAEDGGLAVFKPGENRGISLKNWLLK